jgi:hypothetical protein
VDKKQKMELANEWFSGYDLSLDPLYSDTLVEELNSKKRFQKPQVFPLFSSSTLIFLVGKSSKRTFKLFSQKRRKRIASF